MKLNEDMKQRFAVQTATMLLVEEMMIAADTLEYTDLVALIAAAAYSVAREGDYLEEKRIDFDVMGELDAVHNILVLDEDSLRF